MAPTHPVQKMSIARAASGVLSNIDHQKKPKISTKYRPHSTISTKYLQNYTFCDKSAHVHNAGRPLGFYRISTTKKNPECRPNIDHTALYRPNIDRKSCLKSAHLHYLPSPEKYTFWENEAFREICGIKEDHFNWGHLGKHCIWTTLHYADPKGITAVIILGF